MPNPYEREPGKWYFLDETQDDHGPFNSEQDAERELDEYCKWLSQEKQPDVMTGSPSEETLLEMLERAKPKIVETLRDKPQPDVMTPDGRREVATAMLMKLCELRMKHVMLFMSDPFNSEATLVAAKEYIELENEILELMGVDDSVPHPNDYKDGVLP